MIRCPHCGEFMTEAWVMEHLPESMIMSEGARLMSLRNPRKITPERARKAAQARWKKHRERQEAEGKNVPPTTLPGAGEEGSSSNPSEG